VLLTTRVAADNADNDDAAVIDDGGGPTKLGFTGPPLPPLAGGFVAFILVPTRKFQECSREVSTQNILQITLYIYLFPILKFKSAGWNMNWGIEGE
jgi:hypothetical protein